MENYKSLPTLRMLLEAKPSRCNKLSSLRHDEQCQNVERIEMKYCTDNCRGCEDIGTHLDCDAEARASALKNLLTTIDVAKSGPGHERKSRGVTFNNKVFFDSGEVEDLDNDIGESAVTMYSSKEANYFHDTGTSERIFPTNRKEASQSLSEIEEIPGAATLGEDVKLREETSTVLCKIEQVQAQQNHKYSKIASPSRNPDPQRSSALEITQHFPPQGWPCQLTAIQNMYLDDLSSKLE